MEFTLLIRGNHGKEQLESLELPDGVTRTVCKHASNNSLYVVTFKKSGASLALARELAELRDSIKGIEYHLLDDGPSLRFGQELYKRISTFERLLRKVIALRICAEKDSLEDEFVSSLDKLDFGKIFDALFIGKQFNIDAKEIIRKADSPFEKQDLLSKIQDLDEDTIWNQYFSPEEMPTVAARHREIQLLRNDVMHSHRINYSGYRQGLALLEMANKEMASYADGCINMSRPNGAPSSAPSLYDALFEKIQYLKTASELSQSVLASPEIYERLQEAAASYRQHSIGIERALETYNTLITANPEFNELQQKIAASGALLNLPSIYVSGEAQESLASLWKASDVIRTNSSLQKLSDISTGDNEQKEDDSVKER